MLREVVDALALQPGDTVVDATAGRGGHAEAVARAIGPRGTLVLMDLDRHNLAFAAARASAVPDAPRVEAVHSNFADVAEALLRRSLRADALLADLGFASTQMGDPSRGFSFAAEGPLDMRLNQEAGESAQALLARVDETDLADLIYTLGEDPFSRRIARRIVQYRDLGLLRSTADLARAVVEAYGARARSSRMHPATRTFMALRIAVNGELESLERLLADFHNEIAAIHGQFPGDAPGGPPAGRGMQGHGPAGVSTADAAPSPRGWLSQNARAAILAFHSLEDRLIKRFFSEWERRGWAQRLARKPLVASEAECGENPRARSAKLRSVRIVGV
jgi:16S rRNA (cytosine1402-N4)-methyltransferase